MRTCDSHPFIKTNKTNLGASYVLNVFDVKVKGSFCKEATVKLRP